MPDDPRPVSILDARLAEIDRRLGSIQTGLLAEEDAGAAPATRDELRALAEASRRALAELIEGYDRALAGADPLQVEVKAGPFTSTGSLHGFERSLAELPHVREVTVRRFEGSDRVVFEVRLDGPGS